MPLIAWGIGAAARELLRAVDISEHNPRSRHRAYTQTIVTGPSFWISQALDLDLLFVKSASASPLNPVLIDLRLKQILSQTGRELNLDEIEAMLSKLKRAVSQFNAHPHILEVALALQLGDRERGAMALKRARTLISEYGANATPNLQNIRILEQSLEEKRS